MDNNTLLIIMATLFVVTIIIILVIVLNNAKKTNDLNNELSRSIYEIRSSLNRDFSDLSERLNSNIIQSHKASNEVFSNINEKMTRIFDAQENLLQFKHDHAQACNRHGQVLPHLAQVGQRRVVPAQA